MISLLFTMLTAHSKLTDIAVRESLMSILLASNRMGMLFDLISVVLALLSIICIHIKLTRMMEEVI